MNPGEAGSRGVWREWALEGASTLLLCVAAMLVTVWCRPWRDIGWLTVKWLFGGAVMWLVATMIAMFVILVLPHISRRPRELISLFNTLGFLLERRQSDLQPEGEVGGLGDKAEGLAVDFAFSVGRISAMVALMYWVWSSTALPCP